MSPHHATGVGGEKVNQDYRGKKPIKRETGTSNGGRTVERTSAPGPSQAKKNIFKQDSDLAEKRTASFGKKGKNNARGASLHRGQVGVNPVCSLGSTGSL